MENRRNYRWNSSDFCGGPDLEEIRAKADKELKEERLRHEVAMQKLDEEHNENMRRLNKNPWKQIGGWFGNLFRTESSDTASAERCDPFKSQTTAMANGKDRYRFAGDSSGQCLIIWNKSGNCNEDPVALSQAFLRLGFDVRVRENLKEAEIWKVLRNVTNNTNNPDGCSVCVIVSKGSSDNINSADGKKMKLKNIVDLFSPSRAFALRHNPKVLLFQCDPDNGKNFDNSAEPPFAPKYDDAFVLCSSHARFLPTMKDFMQKPTLGEFQNLMGEIGDKLAHDSTYQQTISFVSTLQKELFLHPKDRLENPPR